MLMRLTDRVFWLSTGQRAAPAELLDGDRQ